VTNLNRRATETANKAMKKHIELAIRNKPTIIKPLYDKLISMGFGETDVHDKDESALSFQAQAVHRRKSSMAAKKETKDEESADLIRDPISERYWRLSQMSVVLLRDRILPAIDDRALSAANLRCMSDPKDASVKETLLRLVELTTGLNPDFGLVGRYRCWVALTELLRERGSERCRRSREVPLPPQFPDDGLFEINGFAPNDDSQVRVSYKYGKMDATIPTSSLPPFQDIHDLYISRNWSEAHAAIASTKDVLGTHEYNLKNHFRFALVALDEDDQTTQVVRPFQQT